LTDNRLVFVAGKGGVGRTCVAAALGLSLAESGKRVLLLEIGETAGLARLFGLHDTPYVPAPVAQRLWICRATPKEALMEYGLMKLKLRGLYNLVFDNPFTRNLVNMLPGMEELLLIGKIGFVVQKIVREGADAPFDMVLVDSPPTGQGLSLFVLPSTILAAVKAGPVVREVARIQELLTSPGITSAVIVTLPEKLALDEALELDSELHSRAGITVGAVAANKVIPSACGPQELELLRTCFQARRARSDLSGLYPVLSEVMRVSEMRERQEQELSRLRRRTNVPIVELPLLPSGVEGMGGLADLGAGFAPVLQGKH